MPIDTFDWQGYMAAIGYPENEIPEQINEDDLQWLYGLWARDYMEELNYQAKNDPFLSTSKEKTAWARNQFLELAPDLAHYFGDEVQPNDPNSTYDPEAFRQHVINNEVQNANLGYYLDTFAASRINEDTDVKYPWLKGLTKDQFKRHFMEQQDIDEAWTSVDDIRNGNFGTLSAKYQEQLARQQGLKGNEKSGHMAALKQGWYEFEKLFGYTAGTLGDAMGVQWLSDIGNEIAQNVIQKSDAYNYRSKYNESLADTIKNQGFMAAGGKILNMAEENWATTAAPLALAAIGKILSTYAHVPQPLADAATRAVAANVVRRQGANLLRRASQLAYASSAALSGLEIGGVRAELEEHGKYDPNNVADVVAAGLVSSSLDFVGNVAAMKGIGITASRLWTHRLAVNEARARLAREIAEDQAKSFTRRVLGAMAIEGVTEGLQEIPAMVVGARRGIEYTPKEVRDRIIDAAAVGAFMGAGIRAGEIALEKYHRGDGDDTPTPTSTEQEPGETPEAAPQTEPQPPPPGFDGAIPPFVTWRQIENGFSVHDEFNVGYGATHEEAARNFIENANKGRVDIDPNRITFVPGSQAGESWVIARYGENGKNSVKVIGQDKEKYIRKIIELHNDPNNAVNLQGDNVFRTDEFRSNNSQLNEDEFIRSILEQKKTKFGSDSRVTAARRDTVDIPVSFDALPRGDRPGTYVTFNLDEDTRTSLRDKGFTILSEPRSKRKGRVQVLRLHRDGFIYTVTLTNNESDQGAHANVKAESIYNLVHGKKGGFSFEGDIDEQVLRVVDTDAVTNLSTSREVKYAVTLSPTLRPGFIEIDRNITPEGREGFTFDPRDVLKKRVEAAKGKIERIGERNISYTSAGETTRLDVTADGRVLVSRDGRFIGDYDFVAGDIGDGSERAIVQSSKIEGQQLFHVVDIPEELQFEGRVTFVYRDDLIGGKVTREYFAIKNDGSVHFIPPAEMNYVDKLLRLPHIQNLNDARDVFGHQFIEFYALPEFYNDGEVRQFVGFKTENNLLPAVNLEDPTLHRFDDMQVDELISAGYNEDFVKVWAIIAPNGEIVRATTEEGVDAFISNIKNYANIIDDSEWNPSSRSESIFGEAYNEQGRYTERDLYGKLYSVEEIYVNEDGTPFSDEDFNHDSDEIRKVSENIISELDREISSIRDQYKKKKILLADKYIRQYESILSSLKDDLSFFGSSPSQYASQYFSGAREFNEAVRRKFYRLRTAQAMLRIDLYRKKIGSTTSILNTQELERIITEDIGDYKENLALEQLREKAIQAESIAVRLEEAYIKTFPLNDSNKITTLLWETIYPDSTEAKYGSFVDRIQSEGTDFRFSRAAETPRVQRKINLLDELNNDIGTFALNEMLERGLRGESGGLVILPDQEAAHEIERRFTTDATQPYYDDAGLIQGFVAPDGIMYLVEDGIVDGKARQIILHEYGVHARKFGMSDAQFQEVVQGIKARRDEKSLEGDFVRHCITRAKQANRNMSEDNPIFWEEVAAYAVEDGYHLADTGIVGRMQTWMKNWLWRFGVIDASAFHYQDFVNMAQGMLGNPGPLSFFDGTHDYTKYQDSWKNLPKFSRSILAEDTPDREEFAQRTYRRLRGLDDAIERERNGEDADSIEQATDWRRNDNGDWKFDPTAWEPRGVQKQAGVNYPNMGEQISGFRYSIGKAAREEYRIQLEIGRRDFSPEQIENVLKELDKYHDAKQYKKVKAALHWVIRGRVILPEDEKKVEEAIKTAENAGVDLISNLKNYESPLDFINEYKEFKPKAPAIDPATVPEFSDPIDLGDGIVTYEVQDTKEGQQAMREIINTHWGEDANPWCLLQGDGKGNLTEDSWEYWSEEYTGLPKRVAFKNGRLISFMAVADEKMDIRTAIEEIISSILHNIEGNMRILENHLDNPIVAEMIRVDRFVAPIERYNGTLSLGVSNKFVSWKRDPSIVYASQYLSPSIRKEIEDEDIIDLTDYREEWINAFGKAANTYGEQHKNVYDEFEKWVENAFKISYVNDDVAVIVDEKGNRIQQPAWMDYVDVTGEFHRTSDGIYLSSVSEKWWDRKDESHPNLDWARQDKSTSKIKYSRITAPATNEELKPYGSFINALENDLVSQRISGVPREGDTVLYQRGDVNEFITRDSLYTIEDADDYYPDLEQRWIDYHRDDSESNFIRYSRSIPETDLVQRFTSQRTSLPQNDPALYKNKWFLKELKEGSENFDIGAGITTKPTERLASLGVRNVPFDPFNREQSENAQVIQDIVNGKRYPTVTVANVLNVIAEPESRSNVILQAAKALDENGKAFFDVYVAPREGETSIGTYQTAMKPEEYLPEIERWFNDTERHGSVIIASSPKEEVNTTEAVWWDANPQVRGNIIRFSRAATIDDVPQTARQRGTQVPNAPGMYKMPDGSLHIEPSELPVGFESETILYAAIAISDPAKEEPKVAELREFITADENLMRLTDQMMEQRKDTNEDHRLGYAVSLILEAYDPASDIYQQTVDAFHEAVSKATGGAYQNLVLDTGQIEAAAHAAAGIPYEPLLTAPQETVPTPRPNTADMEHLRRQEMFAASDAQRAEMQVGEDGRAYISTDDSDVDVVFESKVNTPFDTGRLVDDVLIGASRQGEDDDFYNHLADSPHHGTQEPLDTGRFALPADQHRQEVERFLADSIPEHIWRRVEILWEDNAENNAILGNALGLFKPRSWKNKNIFIKGWNRSFGQVVRSAAREASRFGWGMWQNRDFRRAITEFYDMFQAKIYDELRPYYNQMGITDPAQLSDGQKIYMVQTFFSKMNQSLFTDDQGNMGDLLGISQTEYRRILADVRSGVAAQERDLSAFVEGVANDPELAKRFAAEMLRMTMEASTKMGVHFTYERSSRLGGKDRIRVFTNEWGTYRRKIPNTRFGKAAEEIKNNLRWWRERFNAGEGAEKFARQMMRNLPMSMKYPLKWMHLYVPHARLGDTTLGRASQMISRVWQRIGDTSGTTLARDYALMEDIHGILRAHNYDPLMANDMGNRSYREFFQGLGITSEKDLKKADMADAIVTTAERLKTEGEARIRETIMETGLSLWNRMLDADFSQREINNMVNRFEGYRQRFMLDHYSHRMYEAFTPEGKRELSMLLNYLRRDPRTGEHTLAKRAKEARDAIARAQARYGAATSEFYRETKQARDDLRRWERLQHLWNREMGNAKKYKGLVGAELNAKVVEGMERYILAIVSDSKTHGRFDPQAVPHYNAISAQKARRLDPNDPLDKELMDFLLEIKDPIRNAVYTLDQQRQLITKLEFNKELGEYLLDNNMAGLRSQPDADGLARDLAHMETGSFLEYVNVDPEFMPEIKAEWENMQKVTDTVLGGTVDAVKANSTVYSLRLMMNNYIGNASMLLASGHIWRFKDYLTVGEVIRKQFLDRFTYGAKDPSDFAKMILREMEQNMVTGGSGTEMSVFQLNKGAHERFVQTMTQMLYAVTPLTKRGKFKMDNFVAKLLEKARAFYTYGDEWVKPLIYLNNRASAIAKYQAIEKRYDGETEEDYQERVLKKAIEEASEQTIRETVSWENSPFLIRQFSTRSVRFFAPDFLLHNFQMLRITAANYVRLINIFDELRNFDSSQMNPDKVEAYHSELKKELVRRGVGGAMTAGVYAGLIGATGSCMAYIPYMMNTLMAAIDGEDDKDKDNTFFNPQEWEGAQRILNYKTGGDNFFVPAWKDDGKIYAWNYGRASVMLTHAIPQPATENPEFRDYAAQFFKNIVAIGGGTIAQEIVNNFQGKDKWGRDIGVEAGWWRIFDRVFVPGAVKQLMDMSVGYPGSDNPYREGKAIKMSDAVGITVNAYDMRDIVNELAWDMARVGSNSQNVVRKSFVKRLTQSDALSDSDVASMIGDMREDNARHMDRANYLLTGLRQMGMENKELQHWLTTSRKDAGNILSKKQATAFLKGHNVYDDALVTYLKNRRNNLAKGKDDVRMSREELDVVLQNYDKAIRIYSQALRAQ